MLDRFTSKTPASSPKLQPKNDVYKDETAKKRVRTTGFIGVGFSKRMLNDDRIANLGLEVLGMLLKVQMFTMSKRKIPTTKAGASRALNVSLAAWERAQKALTEVSPPLISIENGSYVAQIIGPPVVSSPSNDRRSTIIVQQESMVPGPISEDHEGDLSTEESSQSLLEELNLGGALATLDDVCSENLAIPLAIIVAKDDVDYEAVTRSKPVSSTECPTDQIFNLFMTKCPELDKLSSVETWSSQRVQRVRNQWRRNPDLATWGRLFDNAHQSDWLCNRGMDNTWVATFDWIIQDKNFPKVLEGTYVNHKKKQTAGLFNKGALQNEKKYSPSQISSDNPYSEA